VRVASVPGAVGRLCPGVGDNLCLQAYDTCALEACGISVLEACGIGVPKHPAARVFRDRRHIRWLTRATKILFWISPNS
ncbi:hypothetical protein, partial [Nocardia vinacea]|uniref:hypothetical protein n=1 Tax=Nocardia vinacea TaxID=96468 RepID=UPI0005930414